MNEPFTVIDVGGSKNGWSWEILDALVDFDPSPQFDNTNEKVKKFNFDITDPEQWTSIRDYVNMNGKFDFSICTHTLEDIANPKFVAKQLSYISRHGFIAVPSKHREFSRLVEGNSPYRGYIHHKYIFNIENNQVIAYPKINFLEYMDFFDKIADKDDNKSDLSFLWKDELDINYVNNNYLGPDPASIQTYYLNLLLN
jgi:hypothetical protein